MIAYTSPTFLDETDSGWLATIVAAAGASAGQPWHVLNDRIDSLVARIEGVSMRTRAVKAATFALKRAIAGRPSKIAPRDIRAAVLGPAVLDEAARSARIRAAATQLDLEPGAIEQLMWSDLSRDRIVTMPKKPIDPREIAAHANVELVERVLRRALDLKLVVHDEPRKFARIVARRGLLAKIERDPDDPGATIFDIVGPLSLFHATTVYGRSIASLAQYLSAAVRWRLEVRLDYGRGEGTVTIASPIVLPPAPGESSASPVAKLARAIASRAPEIAIDFSPPPIERGTRRLFPDLGLSFQGRGRPLEIIGFATDEYLADKLAAYRAANQEPIFCLGAPDIDAVITEVRRPVEPPHPAVRKRAAKKR